jgi:predicted GTPase
MINTYDIKQLFFSLSGRCLHASQIPDNDGSLLPSSLAGLLYPDVIPIYPESDFPCLIRNPMPFGLGIDYAAILLLSEAESDIIIWDGENNDFPFYIPDIPIVVTD